MEDNNVQPEAPTPCTAGCGFYGNKIYNNMCSKCFKEQDERNKNENDSSAVVESIQLEKQQQQQETLISRVITEEPSIQKQEEETNQVEVVVVKTEAQVILPPQEPEQPTKLVQKNKGRCFSCRVKIPLAKQLTNKCRCEYVFCDTHRYPDKHDCNFDHAKNDKDILLKNNPKLHDRPRGGNSFNRLDSI